MAAGDTEQELWSRFGDKSCLFSLLADQRDRGFEVVSTAPEDRAPGGNPEADAAPFLDKPGACDQPDAVSSLPTPSDIFVSYSTFPGEPIRQSAPAPICLRSNCVVNENTWA